jgi:hypothetical protein
MSVKVQSMVWDADIEHNQKFVLIALADQANDFGKECWPSIMRLADKCNLSERAVQTNLKRLEEAGIISRNMRTGRSTYFTIYLDKLVELQKPPRDGFRNISPKNSAKVIHTPAESAPRQNDTPQNLHPAESAPLPANPDSVETPAESAPPQNLHNSEESAPPPRRICTHNHPSIHPLSSTTSDIEVVHNPENQKVNAAEQNDLDAVVELISTWEQGRGKTVKITASDRTKISYWLQVGVSSGALKAAYDTAVAQRQKQGDPTAVSIGYLDSIIASSAKAGQPTSALANTHGSGINAAPWYVTDAGIENEANRMGCKPHPGEPFPQFKLRVLAYKQVPYEQYERDCKSFSNH